MVQSLPTPVPAPTFTLTDLDGQARSLESLRGKVVFLNFWATWCVPCRDEMPALQRLHRRYADRGLAVVGVNFKESLEAARKFMTVLGADFTSVVDTDGAVSAKYRVRGLPVTFLIDRQGRVLWKSIGAREWDGPDGRAHLEEVLARD